MNETLKETIEKTTTVQALGVCATCLDMHPITELVEVITAQGTYKVCKDCVENDTYKCDGCGKLHYKGTIGTNPVSVGGFNNLCPTCYKDLLEILSENEYICDVCGGIYNIDEHGDAIEYETSSGKELACPVCADTKLDTCADCGGNYLKDHMEYIGFRDGYVCDNCMDDYEECEECGEMFPVNDMLKDGNRYYCQGCYDDYYNRCDCCGSIVHHDDSYYIESTDEIYCTDCYDDNTFTCDCCGDCHHNNESNIGVNSDGNEVEVCNSCRDDSYYTCDECGRLFHEDSIEWCESESRYYCTKCSEELNDIQSYYHKPEPVFHGSSCTTDRFFGAEIEISGAGEENIHARELLSYMEKGFMYAKHDGSLNGDGFEMVTHPATLAYHMSANYKSMFRRAVQIGYRAHQTDTCGLHIHVNRTSLGDNYGEREFTILKLLYLTEKHWGKVVKFSRRAQDELEEWADRYLEDSYEERDCLNCTYEGAEKLLNKAKQSGDRYKAINLNNDNTIEFRVFKGTLKYNSFIASIQFVDMLCTYAKENSIHNVLRTTWDDLVDASKGYSELMQYYMERKLFKFADSDGEEL